MKLFGLPASTYFRALWSGRIGHWAATNDAAFSDTWNRIEALPDPVRLILREFLLASNATAEQLVGYQHTFRLLVVDQKTLSVEHFRHFYSILLSYFVSVSYALNPFLKEPLASSLPLVAPNRHAVGTYLYEAEKEEVECDDGTSIVPAPADMERLAALAWQHLAEGFPGANIGDAARLVGFKLVVSQAAIVSFDRIKALLAEARRDPV